MTAIDDLLLANARLQQSTSAARATKDFAATTAKWAQDVEARISHPLPTPAPSPFFDGDPNRTGNLAPWDNFNAGAGDVPVAQSPTGSLSPGWVTFVNDPLGQRGLVYKLAVTKDAHASPAVATDSVYLWNPIKDYLGKPGTDTWVSFGMCFKDYTPEPATVGGITWLCEFHDDNGPWPNSENVFGIVTDHRIADGTVAPQLMARFSGGDSRNPQPDSYAFTNVAIPRDRWIDSLLHVRWSSGADGKREWWLTGLPPFQLISKDGPTLWTNGSATDRPNFEIVNYRPSMTAPSTVYFSRVRIGPTRETVT